MVFYYPTFEGNKINVTSVLTASSMVLSLANNYEVSRSTTKYLEYYKVSEILY